MASHGYTRDDVATLSVFQLRQVITEAGLSHIDCIERSDLRARALQALGPASMQSYDLDDVYDLDDASSDAGTAVGLLPLDGGLQGPGLLPVTTSHRLAWCGSRLCVGGLILVGALIGFALPLLTVIRSPPRQPTSMPVEHLSPPPSPHPASIDIISPLLVSVTASGSTAGSTTEQAPGRFIDWSALVRLMVAIVPVLAVVSTLLASPCCSGLSAWTSGGSKGGRHQPLRSASAAEEDDIRLKEAESGSGMPGNRLGGASSGNLSAAATARSCTSGETSHEGPVQGVGPAPPREGIYAAALDATAPAGTAGGETSERTERNDESVGMMQMLQSELQQAPLRHPYSITI